MPLLKLKISDKSRSVTPRIENTWTDKLYQILKTGGVRTPIAKHCGSVIYNMAVKVVEMGRVWLNIP